MIIYKTTNKITGKIYIGQKADASTYYMGGGVLISKAIKEFGKENFKHETLVQGDFNKDFTNYLEKHYIHLYNSTDRNIGYNIMIGGKSNSKHSPETIQKIRDGKMGNTWNKGRTPSALNRFMTGERFRNRTLSKEQLDAMFEARKQNGFYLHLRRKVSKAVVFDILTDKANRVPYKDSAEKHNLKYPFVSKIYYVTNFYQDWKQEFENLITGKLKCLR